MPKSTVWPTNMKGQLSFYPLNCDIANIYIFPSSPWKHIWRFPNRIIVACNGEVFHSIFLSKHCVKADIAELLLNLIYFLSKIWQI